jgi:hypothetical protein
MIFEEKITYSKSFFSNGLNILAVDVYSGMELCMPTSKPWLWSWGSYGYIGGGCIFQSGVMHANIFGWG